MKGSLNYMTLYFFLILIFHVTFSHTKIYNIKLNGFFEFNRTLIAENAQLMFGKSIFYVIYLPEDQSVDEQCSSHQFSKIKAFYVHASNGLDE